MTAAPRAARRDNLLDDGHDGALALIDGRRTIRDLAFARGRGLYVTMLEVGRMRGSGPWAQLLHDRFALACKRHGLSTDRQRPLPVHHFRRPERSGQLTLEL